MAGIAIYQLRRQPMNKLILAGAAALAALAVPAAAQTVATDAAGNAYVLTPTQQSMYDAWPVERQTVYTGWPNTYKVYYWTLTPEEQNGWWVLTDDQRGKVYAMTPEQRTAAWAAIARQMASMPASSAPMTATPAVVGPTQYTSSTTVQSAPAPAADYPLCSATVQDSCRNPREAGKNYGNRPLNYWPGRPASEIPGKKPQG
jgi:hypothetical protein